MLFGKVGSMRMEFVEDLTVIKFQQLRFIPEEDQDRTILHKFLLHILNNVLEMTLPVTYYRIVNLSIFDLVSIHRRNREHLFLLYLVFFT